MWQVKSGRLESRQIVKGRGECERKKVSPRTSSIRISSTTFLQMLINVTINVKMQIIFRD